MSKPDLFLNSSSLFLVTFNRRHFIDDPNVAVRLGLRIGTAGDALAWTRDYLAQGDK